MVESGELRVRHSQTELQVIPSLRGAEAQLRSQLQGPARSAGTSAGSTFGTGFTGRLQGAFSAAGQALRTALTGAAVATGGVAASALWKGWDRVTTIQDSTAALTVSLGDATKAAELLDQVLEVVRGTPFNFDQFAAAAQQLVGFGVEASKVPRYLTAIGEASATQGKRSQEFAERLSTVFGQIAAQGQVSLADVWRISDIGVNALAILANSFGVTRDEMKDMISKGAVPATEALDALATGILEGTDGLAGMTPALEGTMQALRRTLTGSLGGIGAALARLGAAFITPFTGLLTDSFVGATDFLDALAERVGAFAERLASSPALGEFADWLSDLPSKIGPVVEGIGDLGVALGPLAGGILAVVSGGLSSMLGPLGALVPTLNPLVGIFGGLVVASPQLRDAFAGVLDALGPLATALAESMTPVLAELAEATVPLLVNVIEDVLIPALEFLTEHAEVLGPALLGILAAFLLINSPVATTIAFFAALVGIGSELIETYDKEGFGGVLEELKDGFDDLSGPAKVVAAAVAAIGTAIAAVKIAGMIAGIAGLVASFGSLLAAAAPIMLILGALVVAWLLLKDSLFGLWHVIRDDVLPFLGRLNDQLLRGRDMIFGGVAAAWRFLMALFGRVGGAVAAVARAIGRAWRNLQDGARLFRQAIGDALRQVVQFFRELPGRVASALARLPIMLANAGRAAIRGLRNGITAAWGAVISFIRGIPGRIVGAIPNPGGLLYNIGRAIIQGLIDGIRAALPALWDQISSIPGRILDLKGPLPKDKVLLVPAGRAIMDGLQVGLEEGWRRGPSRFLAGIAPELAAAEFDFARRPARFTARSTHTTAAKVTIDVTGTDRDLVRMVRKMVRVEGGNVQAVLGAS